MRDALHHLFTLPRLAAAMLISGVLLTILAVSALASAPAPEAAPTIELVPSATTPGSSPAVSRRSTTEPATGELDEAATIEQAEATATIAPENEGAVEPVPETVVEAARSEASATGRFSMPLAAWVRVTDRYGAPRGNGLVHGGIDLAVGGHVPILAACDGVVSTSTYSGVYGNYVVVTCGEGWATLYGHLSSLNVEVGDRVTRGTGLGRSGSTGYSTGEHLHFEIWYGGTRVNPEHYLDFKIPPGTPLSDGPIVFPRSGRSGAPTGGGGGAEGASSGEATEVPTEAPPTATPTATSTATPTATPTVTNTPTPTPTPSPPPPTPTPTPRPVFR